MELGLAGKGALVTGGSMGIGKAVAWALAKEGVDVAISARRREPLEQTANEIAEATGRNVVPIVADMGVLADVHRFVDEAARRLGRIDILVNNAGAAQPGFVLDLPDEAFVDAINVKILGYIRCARAVVPYMRQRGGGCIIMISGGASRQPPVGAATMGIVNSAVVNFTKSMSDAVARENIRVVAISPGAVRNERQRYLQEVAAKEQGLTVEEVARRAASNIPLGRLAEPEEIADLILFLASDHARFITGSHVLIDGGAIRAAF